MATITHLSDDQVKLKNIATVVYLLQILALFNGITALVGVIINYIKLDATRGTWLESHFRWQINTFWIALLLSIVGFITIFILIGYFILLFNTIWIIYRVIKGWLYLNDIKPVY